MRAELWIISYCTISEVPHTWNIFSYESTNNYFILLLIIKSNKSLQSAVSPEGNKATIAAGAKEQQRETDLFIIQIFWQIEQSVVYIVSLQAPLVAHSTKRCAGSPFVDLNLNCSVVLIHSIHLFITFATCIRSQNPHNRFTASFQFVSSISWPSP